MRSVMVWAVGLSLLLCAPAARANVFDDDPVAGSAMVARADLPEEFVEETAFDNLVAPASIAFSPDGRVFVGQLDGRIMVFDSVTDTTGSVYADLTENVAFHADRGLIGLTLDPGFTTGRPYLYALYTYDAPIGGTAPVWNDECLDGEGDGCKVSGRLSKILPDGTEQPLITDEWCQQYTSHSVGDLKFGPDGALYVSAGDGASYTFADYGQGGSAANRCADPVNEGGALRSQDVRTKSDPTGLNGALLRIDPDTGAPLPDNPGTGSVNERRIVAHGFRNPFRFAFRPGTTDAYVADVGWLAWEELNRVPDPTSKVRNYGWPCYEGYGPQQGYAASGLDLCEDLYDEGAGAIVPPLYAYNHASKVADENCSAGTSSISGVTFYDGTSFPLTYKGAMFFADYARECIWVMFAGEDGTPDPATRQVFVDGAKWPVDLEVGPGGDLYYANVATGTVQRIRAVNPNRAPNAILNATPAAGRTPLEVHFDGTGSTDPNQDELTYAWDLDGDGEYDDSTDAKPSRTYTTEGQITVRLRVTDPSGDTDTDAFELTVGIPPTADITAPGDGATYAVGDTVAFAGTGEEADGTAVPADRLIWTVDLHHCSAIVTTSCHVHRLQEFIGRSGTLKYPDHEFPSYVTLTLTAQGPSGLRAKTSVRIDPKTVELTFDSVPSGLSVAVGGEASTTPFKRTVARGSTVGVAAPASQLREGFTHQFESWSDGGSATHQFVAAADQQYTVRYQQAACQTRAGLVGAWSFDETSGAVVYDSSGQGNAGTIEGAVRTANGRFGRGLQFDGLDDLVTVDDDASLDLAAGLTLEGWVKPDETAPYWRTMMLKEREGALAYSLYTDNGTGPSGHVSTPFESRAEGEPLPAGSWSHVAVTYDGAHLQLFVNGEPVADTATTGAVTVSDGALRFGGNRVWGEWLAGQLDELRIYNRALSVAELRSDMTLPITCVVEPELEVQPEALTFSATVGDTTVEPKTIDVTGGTATFTASADVPWLDVATASRTVSVTPELAGLTAGTHTGTVTIEAGAATKTVAVTLTLDPAAGCTNQPGLVGAWGFDDRIDGTISGASRVASGRFGGALRFDGEDDWVTIADDPSLDLTDGMTLSAWVNPSEVSGSWRTVLFKERGEAMSYALYAGTDTPQAGAFVAAPREYSTKSTANVATGTWTHLAATYDGANLRLFVNGAQVSSRALSGAAATGSGPLRIGGNGTGDEWFAGLIDEVRVYDRALSASELRGDMAAPVTCAAAEPKLSVTPAELTFRATQGGTAPEAKPLQIANDGDGELDWTVAEDAAWLTVSPKSGRDAGTVTVTPTIDGLEPGTYRTDITVSAGTSQTIPVTLTVDPPPPALTLSTSNLAFTAAQGSGNPAAQSVAVTNTGGGTLSFEATDDASWLTVTPASGSAPATLSVAPSISGLTQGTYTATVTVTGASATKTVAVTLTITAPVATGLVAAYGFEEPTGTTVADGSGLGNAGRTSGATRATGGRFGRALSLDGINDWMTVNDADSLDVRTGITMSAWVRPTALGSTARTVLAKEMPDGLVYSLFASDAAGAPSGRVFTTSEFSAAGTVGIPLNQWTHLAATWDRTTLRLFANGVEVANRPLTGTIRASGGPLRIGGNVVFSQFFQGLIDEVRVYNRALSLPELQGDMNSPVPAPG